LAATAQARGLVFVTRDTVDVVGPAGRLLNPFEGIAS
jgi:hypothetical protein